MSDAAKKTAPWLWTKTRSTGREFLLNVARGCVIIYAAGRRTAGARPQGGMNMFTKHMALHEGGHGHAGCCGQHEHEHAHEHVCGHHHEHGAEVPELTPEQTLALMSYMAEHNRSHAAELHGVAHSLEKQGKLEAATLVAEAVHYFDHCNDKLDEALRLVKGE